MLDIEPSNQSPATIVTPLAHSRKRRWPKILLWSAGGDAHSRKRRWPKILLWSAGGLLAPVLLAAVAGVLWLRSAATAALPVLDGDLHLAGLSAPVIVRRDAHGRPHIEGGR